MFVCTFVGWGLNFLAKKCPSGHLPAQMPAGVIIQNVIFSQNSVTLTLIQLKHFITFCSK